MNFNALLKIVVWMIPLLSGFSYADEKLCLSLGNMPFSNAAIEKADYITSGIFLDSMVPNFPAKEREVETFCRVIGTIKPSIGFEVWLPDQHIWNGKLKSVGGGGFNGIIRYDTMIPALNQNYVTASTDAGHKYGELDWLVDDRFRDHGYRAIHEMTLKTKAIIKEYYGREQDFAYFSGCSTGGRQGLMEAQRFPDDYDGILSGAPVNNQVLMHVSVLWNSLAARPQRGQELLKPKDLSLLGEAIKKQCDLLDGIQDGLLDDPRKCNFDIKKLACSKKEKKACLTSEQLNAINKIYSGPINPRTGERINWSVAKGGELLPYNWNIYIRGAPPEEWDVGTIGEDLRTNTWQFFARAVKDDLSWDWRTFDFDNDVDLALNRTSLIMDAVNPNLDAFQVQGGKMILYTGWNDSVVFPEAVIEYYTSVIDNLPMSNKAQAAKETAEFFRLFMVPGMTHCRGGDGVNAFGQYPVAISAPLKDDAQHNVFRALEAWVEKGVAPKKIIAVQRDGEKIIRTRPLCPYPETAKYNKKGDINEAVNFECAK